MSNHWNDDGDLVIEEKTLFRQVGWLGQSGDFYLPEDHAEALAREPGGFGPVYQQIATWVEEEGWRD